MDKEQIHSIAYAKNTVEFVTVAHQFCTIIEQISAAKIENTLSTLQKVLPLLYIKATLLPNSELQLEEPLEKFVSELEYSKLHQKWLAALGENDSFYEVFNPDIQFGSELVTASIAENLLDIYQDVKDFLLSYQLGVDEIMHDTMLECAMHFKDFWGQQLVNVLRAVHALIYSNIDFANILQKPLENEPTNHNEWLDRFWGTATDE